MCSVLQIGKLQQRLERLQAALSHLRDSYLTGKAQQAAQAYSSSTQSQVDAWLGEARALEEQAAATQAQAAAADVLSKRCGASVVDAHGVTMHCSCAPCWFAAC